MHDGLQNVHIWGQSNTRQGVGDSQINGKEREGIPYATHEMRTLTICDTGGAAMKLIPQLLFAVLGATYVDL